MDEDEDANTNAAVDVDAEGEQDAQPDAAHATAPPRASKRKQQQPRIRKEAPEQPGGGRKGVSSGLSTVIKRKDTKTKSGWWKDLGGSKGSLRL